MDMVFCMMMAIYMMLAANSKQTKGFTENLMYGLSIVMAFLAVLHILQ